MGRNSEKKFNFDATTVANQNLKGFKFQKLSYENTCFEV